MHAKRTSRWLIVSLLCLLSISCFADETITVYEDNHLPKKALVLFYLASCPHCRRFAPIVKTYAMQHHMVVLAYRLHGVSLPSFPDSVTPTPDEIAHFFPEGNVIVPTLFLIDPQRQQIIRVLQGEATAEQLAQRIEEIKAIEVEHD